MSERADHWERTYATRPSTELSWYQRDPVTSRRLIESAAAQRAAAVIDVGGGSALLADSLVAAGYLDVTVLDISAGAVDAVRARLGGHAAGVHFVVADVLTWVPDRQFDVWHDRAVFHFLIEVRDRQRYVDVASRAIRAHGALVIGAFAEDGPTHCSGLPVCRYAPGPLAEVFRPSFELVAHEREEHTTPQGVVQPFTWVVLRRR